MVSTPVTAVCQYYFTSLGRWPWCFLAAIVTVALLYLWRYNVTYRSQVSRRQDHWCPSTNCVRCKSYSGILNIAAVRYRELPVMRSERMKRAVQERCVLQNTIPNSWLCSGQCPNVFVVPGLTALPWHDVVEFGDDLDVLQTPKTADMLRKEFQQIFNHPLSVWQTNQTSGQWNVFHLVNQGQQIEQNCAICPHTWSLLRRLQSSCCMIGNVFGNASFSVVKPGCHITSHCGPTNIRLRCHVPLYVPDSCSLRVNTTTRSWVEDDCLIFDDSFEHEVWHNGDSDDGDRVIFMFDLWHPDLTLEERSVVDVLFRP